MRGLHRQLPRTSLAAKTRNSPRAQRIRSALFPLLRLSLGTIHKSEGGTIDEAH